MNANRSRGLALIAAWMLALSSAPAVAQPVLSLEGSCPGPMRAEVREARPTTTFLLLFAPHRGSYTFPRGHWCEGVTLGLGWRGLQIAASARTDENGFAVIEGTVGDRACGGYLQTFGHPSASCEVSNVVQVPR